VQERKKGKNQNKQLLTNVTTTYSLVTVCPKRGTSGTSSPNNMTNRQRHIKDLSRINGNNTNTPDASVLSLTVLNWLKEKMTSERCQHKAHTYIFKTYLRH
jgi:hypothetical protein